MAFQRAKMSPQDTQINTISCIFHRNIKLNTKLSGHSNRRPKYGFNDYRIMQVKSILFNFDYVEWPFLKGGVYCN